MAYDLSSSRWNNDPAPASERDRGTVSDRLAELARAAQSHYDSIRQSDAGQMDGRQYSAAASRVAPEWPRSPPSNVMRDTPPASGKLADERGLAAAAHEGYEQDCYCDDGSLTGFRPSPLAARSRAGMLAVLTLVGCVILAGAAAYSFRNYFAEAAPSAEPDVLVNNTPNVIDTANDPQEAGKVIHDSFAAQGREVEANSPSPGSLTTAPLSSIAPPAAPPSGSATAPSSTTLDDPKPVRALTMQRDANDPNGQMIDVTPSTRAPDAAATRDSPQQLDEAPSASATAGAYVVQLSAQRSEARAQASIRLMQTKYPSGFGGRSSTIKRSDLGTKGVLYRALVGPFASAGDAGKFCGGLKAAGGDCIVQKN